METEPVVSLTRAAAFAVALLWLVAAPVAAAGQTPAPPRHRALLIGISDYARGVNPSTEWWDLSSSADIAAMRALLIEKFAFDETDIVALTSRPQTTRDSILAALETLIADTRKGDIIYIHYSGHGAPVVDLDGDEIDGLDESIVPSDYVARRDGSRNITDDTIGAALAKLHAREPASVTLTFDSCFSGTQTRGGRMVVRGGNFLGLPQQQRAGDDPDVTGLGGRAAFADGYVVISAARHDQVAAETDDGSGGNMGLLSYALVQQMRAAGPETTYRDLFDGLLDAMTTRNPGQVPQIEGNIDSVLLSGVALPPQPYFETRTEDGKVILQAGSLHGITAGSQFALYSTGTRTFGTATPLTRAEAASVRATTTVLKLLDPVDIERLRLARAVETAHKFGDTIIRVDVSDLDRLARGREVLLALDRFAADRGLVRLTRGDAWDLKICGPPCAEEIATNGEAVGPVLIRHDGSRAASLNDTPDLPAIVVRAIEAEARWRMIAALERTDPRVQVDVRLAPVTVTRDVTGAVTAATRAPAAPRLAGGQPTMTIGDNFMVELRNTGSLDAYVTVLDLSPDGSINPIWPHPGVGGRVQDNKLRAAPDPTKAEWVLIPFPYVFRVGPPSGNEIIKVIATDTPTDFSPLLSAPAARSVGASRGEDAAAATPIGRLLASVARGTRGAALATEPPDPTVWSTGSFTFVIPAATAPR